MVTTFLHIKMKKEWLQPFFIWTWRKVATFLYIKRKKDCNLSSYNMKIGCNLSSDKSKERLHVTNGREVATFPQIKMKKWREISTVAHIEQRGVSSLLHIKMNNGFLCGKRLHTLFIFMRREFATVLRLFLKKATSFLHFEWRKATALLHFYIN